MSPKRSGNGENGMFIVTSNIASVSAFWWLPTMRMTMMIMIIVVVCCCLLVLLSGKVGFSLVDASGLLVF